MHYDIVKINKDECSTSEWSGGSTTELCIYPSNAQYKSRNFKWRVSSATIDDLESDFTNLPGINRVLMVLNGSMKLEHKDYYEIQLDPFEKDAFEGGWNTKSYGRGVDLNIMTDKSCMGTLIHLEVEKEVNVQALPRNETYNNTMSGLYIPKGDAVIKCNNKEFHCKSGDLLSIYYSHYEDNPDVRIYSENKLDVVGIHIEY